MNTYIPIKANQSELVHSKLNQFGSWLKVAEAVTYCSLKGLNRTPKTIRKWAMRSFQHPENAEISVRREDIETGFRWSIEKVSLDRKIEQELEFESRKPVEQVQTDPDKGTLVQHGSVLETQEKTDANQSELGQTGSLTETQNKQDTNIEKELRNQISQLTREVDFYREELRDRRQSATALTDVIKAFRLNAENSSPSRTRSEHHDIKPATSNSPVDTTTSENELNHVQ